VVRGNVSGLEAVEDSLQKVRSDPNQPLAFPAPPLLTELPYANILMGSMHLHGDLHPHDTDGAHRTGLPLSRLSGNERLDSPD
jgi:hypothetical protein